MPNRIRSNFNHEVSIWLRPHCLNSLQISPRRKGKGIQFSITGIVVYLLNHAQLFSNSMDCSPPGSSVHGISQARILEWVAFSFSRESSWLKDQTHASCIGRQVLYHWARREAHYWNTVWKNSSKETAELQKQNYVCFGKLWAILSFCY